MKLTRRSLFAAIAGIFGLLRPKGLCTITMTDGVPFWPRDILVVHAPEPTPVCWSNPIPSWNDELVRVTEVTETGMTVIRDLPKEKP